MFGVAQQGISHIVNKSQDEIVAAFKANDESVMKVLYSANYQKVRTYVLQNNGSASEAKDVYQEAFIAVWKNVKSDRFTPKSETSLSGYLYRIAKNKWLDYLRSAHHKKTVSENMLHAVPLNRNQDEQQTEEAEKESIRKVMEAFGGLGEQCKTMLQQFYFYGWSHRQIAAALNLEESSVRNQKYRCMQKLREMVQNAERNRE